MSGVADLFRCPPSHTEAATWAPPNWPHWVAPQLRSTKKLCRSENFREPHALTRSPSPSYLPLPTELASGRAGGSRAHACGTAKVPGGKIILCGPVLSVSYGATTTTSEVLCGTLFWSVTGAVGGRKAGTCHTKSCRAGIRSVGLEAPPTEPRTDGTHPSGSGSASTLQSSLDKSPPKSDFTRP